VLETAVRGGTAILQKDIQEVRDVVHSIESKEDAKVARESARASTPEPETQKKNAGVPTAALAEPAAREPSHARASAPPPEAEAVAPAPVVASPRTQTAPLADAREQWGNARPQTGQGGPGGPGGAPPGQNQGSPYGISQQTYYGAPPASQTPQYAYQQQPQRSPGPPPPPNQGYPLPGPHGHYPPPPGGTSGGPPHGGPPHGGLHGGPQGGPGGFGPGFGAPPGGGYGSPYAGGPRAPPASFEDRNVKVSMDKVVEDFSNMGFTRDQVVGVIRELQQSGQSMDLNVVLDRLMNPRR